MTIEWCGCYIVNEWKCTKCGNIWTTDSFDEVYSTPATYPNCPNCGEKQ